jgi:Zn-finger nucleic acid-binding protein
MNKLDKETQQIVFSIARIVSSKWNNITYDDCVSEGYMWLAEKGLDKINEMKKADPYRWKNTLGFSLKNAMNDLAAKEQDYYNHNNGSISATFLEENINNIKPKTFLNTPSYYTDREKLKVLLQYAFTPFENISENDWKQNIPFVSYKKAQSILVDIHNVVMSLTKQQKQTLTKVYVEKKMMKDIAEEENTTSNAIEQRSSRLIKLITKKLQSGYSAVW